jgi:hypothetical protein
MVTNDDERVIDTIEEHVGRDDWVCSAVVTPAPRRCDSTYKIENQAARFTPSIGSSGPVDKSLVSFLLLSYNLLAINAMLINIGIWESAGRLCSRMLYAG